MPSAVADLTLEFGRQLGVEGHQVSRHCEPWRRNCHPGEGPVFRSKRTLSGRRRGAQKRVYIVGIALKRASATSCSRRRGAALQRSDLPLQLVFVLTPGIAEYSLRSGQLSFTRVC
jgi:hypothetical protein